MRMTQSKKSNPSLSLKELGDFFDRTVEPNLQRIISEEIQPLRSDMNQGFDDLYKKFEDLKQEYIFANQQLKRQDTGQETIQKDLLELKSKVLELQKEIEVLEEKIKLH